MDGGDRNGGTGVRSWRRQVTGQRRSRRVRLVALAALAMLVPLVFTAGARASVPRSFFGVVPWGSFEGADFQRLESAKVRNARTPFHWNLIEPSRGHYSWAGTDRVVGTLAYEHVRVLPFLNDTPSWVAGDRTKPPVRSKKAKKAWGHFLQACIKRYGRHGEYWRTNPNIPKTPITAWQIWNEPNLANYFDAKKPPRTYAKLVKVSDKAINKADKHAKTVLAGLSGNPETKKMTPQRFLKKMLKVRKVKKHFNAAALHPYAPSIKKFKKLLRNLHNAMKKRGAGSKKVWITEMGWGSAHPEKGKPLLKGTQGQKRLLKKSFRMLLHHRKQWHIKRVYWFLWRDANPAVRTNCTFCKSSGLFRYDFSPKPSWKAFRSFTRR
jgi:polysaccharide biosynthesis protein PslG